MIVIHLLPFAVVTMMVFVAGCELSDTVAADGEDNDCDGRVDEEMRNFVDDDGDGLVDEDLATDPVRIRPPVSASLHSCLQPTNPSHAGRPVVLNVSAACRPVRTIHSDLVAGSACSKTITREWMSVDACGNVANATQLVVIEDKTPPTLSAPGNVTVTCTEFGDATKTGVARAHDDCDRVSMWHEDRLSRCTVERRWFARDSCGNSAPSATQSIALRLPSPHLQLPDQKTITCFDPVIPSFTGQPITVGSTLCGWNVSVVVQLEYQDREEIINLCDRVIRRRWLAYDTCGKKADGIQLVRVLHQSPVLNEPIDAVSSCRNVNDLSIVRRLSFNKSCVATRLEYSDILDGSTLLRNWTAVDICGASAVPVVQRITLAEPPPDLVVRPNVTIGCHESSGPDDVGWAVLRDVNDACFRLGASRTTVTYRDERHGPGCPGFILRHWTATSFLGHTVQADQVITLGKLRSRPCTVVW